MTRGLLFAFGLWCLYTHGLPLRGQSFGSCGGNICASTGASVGIGTTTPTADLDIGGFSAFGAVRSVLARHAEGSTTGTGTYLGVRAWGTQYSVYNGKSFSIEHAFYGYTNSAINFYRGPGAVGGYMRFATNYGIEQMTIDALGNVGIGTMSPQALLHVQEPASTTLDWIGTLTNPVNYGGSGYGVGLRLQNSTGGAGNELNKWVGVAAVAASQYSNQTDMVFYTNDYAINTNQVTPPRERMRVQSTTGNVGIGTTAPQYPLSVNGVIQAKEVLVNTNWSDYVFDPGYRLAPLSEVAAYVRENRHLPDIPSAAEVAEKGISVGEMQAKLLAKIEELMLHMIAAERENRELKERLGRLEQRR